MNEIKKIKTDLKGLGILNGSYYYRKSIKGERLNVTIGRVDEITKAEAEELAIKARMKALELGVASFKALGIGSNLSRLRSNKQTLRDVLVTFLESMSRRGSKKTQGKPFRKSELDNYDKEKRLRWTSLLDLPIDSITEEHVRLWHMKIEERKNPDGSYQESATYYSLTRLNRLLQWAKDERIIDFNPAKELANSGNRVTPRKKTPDSEDRLDISTNELGRFLFSLIHSKPKQNKRNINTSRDVILMALMTGARKEEIFNMKWDWIPDKKDFRYILSPAEVEDEKRFQGTKGRREYYYACSRIIQLLLKGRYKQRERLANVLGGDASLTYVFPNNNGTGPIWDIRKRIKSICDNAGINKTIGMHDIRRTFADVCGATPVDRPAFPDRIIKRATQHKDSDLTTGIYMADDPDTIQIHGIFQHVEEFCSQAIYTGTIYDTFLRRYKSTGVKRLSKDNKTIEDGRSSNVDALRRQVFLHPFEQEDLYQNIWKGEEEVLTWIYGSKKKIPPIWKTKTIGFSNLLLETDPKLKAIRGVFQQRLNQHKGDMCIFRVNLHLLIHATKIKTKEQIKAKFPKTYSDIEVDPTE